MKKCFVFVLDCAFFITYAQHNLVPNGDFEEYSTCQTSINQLGRALYWTNPMLSTTPDYFNACSSNLLCSVPINAMGYEPAHSGIAYAAIGTVWIGPVNPPLTKNYREYIQVELTDALVEGVEYCIQFFVSAGDSFNYVSKDMGVYFSKVEIQDTCNKCVLPYIPQFENIAMLDNRNGWTEVSGSYLAEGEEKFIVIGNYKDSSATASIYTGWVTDMNRNQALYYVDNVSLSQCDTISGIKEDGKNPALKVYPNPSSGILFLESDINLERIEVFNLLGNLVYHNNFTGNNRFFVNLSNQVNGIYLLKAFFQNSFHQYKPIKINSP